MSTAHDSSSTLVDYPDNSVGESTHGDALILALDRLFKVGPYYPPGHAACRRVTSDFQTVLKHFLGEWSKLTFRVDKGVVFLQDHPLNLDLAGAKDFHDLILTLGVDHLEIDGNASVEDLLKFVTRFLAFRNELAGVKKFQQMEFVDLPPSIRVAQRQFTTGIAIGGNSPETGNTDKGNVAEENTESSPEVDAGDPPEEIDNSNLALTDNLDHALNPNGTSVAAPPKLAENKRPVAENLDKLIDRLEGASQSDIRSRALESVELMIKNLGRSEKKNDDHSDFLGAATQGTATRGANKHQKKSIQKKPSEKPAENKPQEIVYDLSLPELRSALADYAGKAITEYSPPEQDNSENLSILIQLLASKQLLDVLLSMERKLDCFLQQELQPDEREIMLAGMRNILSQPESIQQNRALSLVARVFRKSKPESVIRFLGDICNDCSEDQKLRLWPYLVNELLLGQDGEDRPVYMELCRRVGGFSPEIMRTGTPTLRKLDALKKNSFSADVILPPLPELFAVFSVLLEVSHPGQIAVKLVQGLKYSSPDGVGDAVLPLISNYRHGYREFLVELLAPGQEDGPSAALLEEAGKILASDLIALSPTRRGERWVPETIASLAVLPVPGAKSILKTIKGRRFLFLFPTWSKECRNAAKKTLEQIRINELAAAAADEAKDEELE